MPTEPVPIGADPPVIVIRNHEGLTAAWGVAINAAIAVWT